MTKHCNTIHQIADKHKVSDFVRKRGRTQNQVEDDEPEEDPLPRKKLLEK